ncbi:LapA family protein [Xenophilus arseniciresistens]|uniref:LapA family protein n=1 Tax=Xenophilus arseniciresistens TaxID=1283306 RepID=A0AAE3SYE7_9BURK|nr:LapA family protein [Xenophilus arseniciresistens]MDA7415954.1 LapA family protein [Xenophilus arseniciresistens]
MGVRTGILLVVVLLIAGLAALNWATLATPAAVSLGFMQVSAPLGLLMLGLTTLLGLMFLVYVIYMQGTVLVDARRHTKEMQAQRELADKAEASRFTELRNFLAEQERQHMAQNGERHAAMLARIERLEEALRLQAEQADRTLAAHMGQLEDRLDRGAPAAAPAVVVPPAEPRDELFVRG